MWAALRAAPMFASRVASTSFLPARAPSTRLEELCEFAPEGGTDEEVVFWFVRLVQWLRPRADQRLGAKLRFLSARLEQNPTWERRFDAALRRLVTMVDVERLLTHGGISQNFHLAGAVKEWLLIHALPEACKTDDGAQIIRLAFFARDAEWLRQPELMELFAARADEATRERLRAAVDHSLVDLAHQIMAQAHAPSVRQLAQRDRSPYRGLFDAVAALPAGRAQEAAAAERSLRALLGRIRECTTLLQAHRRELAERGADLNTTFQLSRLQEQLARLGLLARLRAQNDAAARGETLATLVAKVARSGSGRRLFARSSDLVIQNLVDAAANVGRRYLGSETSSFAAAFRAGAGGGALMAVAAVLKFLVGRLHLPTLYEGIAYSLNYGAVFCAAYLLHFTIATKLPAHTAAALARGVQDGPSHRARLRTFLGVWRSALRLQVAGLFGNLVVAGPLAFLFDVAIHRATGAHLLDPEKAHHVMQSQSILGPSAAYAALAGVFLWVSSLIGAGGDNWIRVVRLSDRLATNRHAMAHANPVRARARAEAVLARVGGLMGNASLGFFLGMVPAACAIAQLPVEIRHITVSTSSVALALSAGANHGAQVPLALAGLVLIALVNVGVSFLLALTLALRATRSSRTAASSQALVRIALRRAPLGTAAETSA